jgi:hypothetical protein
VAVRDPQLRKSTSRLEGHPSPPVRTLAIVIGMIAVTIAWLGWVSVAAGATLKDDFGAREKAQGLPVVADGSNVGADRETGEPVLKPLAPAGHSVWLEWEATSSGYVTVSTCGSAIPTVIGVYGGTELESLNEWDSEANFGGPGCTGIRNGVTFQAFSGFEYQIVVDGNSFFVPPASPPTTEGAISLRIDPTPPPANDNFADAASLVGTIFEEPGGTRFYFANAFGYNWAATQEAGEPDHAGDSGGASVWYTWIPPESGTARVSVCCGAPDLLGIYFGSAFDQLSKVQSSGTGSIELPVTAGATYRIAVDGKFIFFLGSVEADKFDLSISMRLAPRPIPPVEGSAGGPASRDVKAPNTTILRRKVRAKTRSATFSFRSSEPGSSFRCRLDRRKSVACSSPKTYSGLAAGRHKFEVFAFDAAGNKEPAPAAARFAVPQPKSQQAKG